MPGLLLVLCPSQRQRSWQAALSHVGAIVQTAVVCSCLQLCWPVAPRPCVSVKSTFSNVNLSEHINLHFPYTFMATAVYDLAAASGIRAVLTPAAEYFNTLGVPDWLVHWGHPGNMAVVLFAMGGYGAGYLGWQIRLSEDGVS